MINFIFQEPTKCGFFRLYSSSPLYQVRNFNFDDLNFFPNSSSQFLCLFEIQIHPLVTF